MLVRRLCSELLGRPVGFRLVVEGSAAAAGAATPMSAPMGQVSSGLAATALVNFAGPTWADRIPRDPQVAEFIRLFQANIVDAQDFKTQG